jgi:hypothetical protein
VLNAENAMIMESLGLADTKDIVDMFFNVLIEKQDLQIALPRPSPPQSLLHPAKHSACPSASPCSAVCLCVCLLLL